MKLRPPISDDDIEALLSGRLSPGRLALVESALSEQPALRDRVDALRADQDALRAIADSLLAEPVPQRLLTLLDDATAVSKRRRHGT
jgi:anti-sigma factor RsiW